MRSPGEAGAPTAGQFKQAAKTAKAEDGVKIVPPSVRNLISPDATAIKPPQVRPITPKREDLIRPDGTMKDVGFLGVLKSPSGKDVTEYSVGVPIMGKEMDIPVLVPGLSKEEIAYVLQRADKDLPIGTDAMGNAIVQKASQHAMQRVKQGMSPFYSSVIDKAIPEMPADATVVKPVQVPVMVPPKAENGMMIAPISALNSKIKSRQKAAEGMLITPPEMSDSPAGNNPPIRNRATTQDSLDVYNQQKLVDDYYKNKNYKPISETKAISSNSDFNKMLDKNYEDFTTTGYPSKIVSNNKTIEVKNDTIKDLYRRNKNKNQLYQRESAFGMLDTKAPMPLYDRRITPQFETSIVNTDNKSPLYKDSVDLMSYDPIAVKPLSMMTPAERKIREEKYPKSIPAKPKPTPVKPKIVVPEELEPKNANYLLTNSEISNNRKPEMVSIPKPAQKPPPALQYPGMNQTFLEKVKSFITGKKEMPYWTDRQGEKHYPHLGESNPEAVKKIKMLKSGLNPLIPEDAKELRRINSLLEMSSKDRLNNIRNAKER
jgi:hypothetical protein